jgi:uncharacterized phage protein (TIGR02218 family)
MKTLPAPLAAHVGEGVTTLCHCWRVTRRDNVMLGFTDHDRDLVLDGVTYKAASGFTASAIESQLGLAVSNLDVEGALTDDAITETDLSTGRYDDAAVTIFLVNWQDVTQRAILRSGFIGQVRRGRLAFSAELRGLASRLDQTSGRVFQRSCACNLGDARCGVSLAGLTRTRNTSVTQVFDSFSFACGSLGSMPVAHLAKGKLVWTSGPHAGTSVEIRSAALVGTVRRLTLLLPAPQPIAVGHTCTVTVGCDRSATMCRERYANMVNFGGFPHMPGNDFAMSYPNRGDRNDGGRRT